MRKMERQKTSIQTEQAIDTTAFISSTIILVFWMLPWLRENTIQGTGKMPHLYEAAAATAAVSSMIGVIYGISHMKEPIGMKRKAWTSIGITISTAAICLYIAEVTGVRIQWLQPVKDISMFAGTTAAWIAAVKMRPEFQDER